MNVLILGGAGFLGSNLARHCLSHDGVKVTIVDSLDPLLKSSLKNLDSIKEAITFIEGDIRRSEFVEFVVKGQDVIFNCAAQSSHPLSMTNPVLDVDINCKGHLTVLEVLRKVNSQAKIVFPSSSTVVGKMDGDELTEDSVRRPLDIYSANKGVAEQYYRIYSTVHGLKTLILRFPNLYGPFGKGFPEFGFLNYFISLANAGKAITLFGEGEQTRNILFVNDAVKLLYQASLQDDLFGDLFFAVGGEHPSVRMIARTICDVFPGGTIEQVAWPQMRKKMDVEDIRISGKKLRDRLDWQPQFGLAEGLLETKRILEEEGVTI